MNEPRALIGKEIVFELTNQTRGAQTSIEIFFYSASTMSARTPLAISNLMQEYKKAPARGIKCRALLASWSENNPQGIESSKFASQLKDYGWHCKFAAAQPILHPKTWIFDAKHLITGSHNSTTAGLMMNKNISILTCSTEAANRVLGFFNEEWEKAKGHA